MPEDRMKVCRKCGGEKSISNFYSRKSKGILTAWCQACRNINQKSYFRNRDRIRKHVKEYRKKYPEKRRGENKKYRNQYPNKVRDSRLRYYFGITLSEWNRMFIEQGGVCAICKKPETFISHKKIDPLSVDHNHTTGQVRGLLCRNCNSALGFLDEDTTRMMNMIEYLQRKKDG